MYQGESVPFQHPAPVGGVWQHQPDWDPKRPGKVRDRSVYGDHDVQCANRGGRFAPIREPTGKVGQAE